MKIEDISCKLVLDTEEFDKKLKEIEMRFDKIKTDLDYIDTMYIKRDKPNKYKIRVNGIWGEKKGVKMKNITFERQEIGKKYWYIDTWGTLDYSIENGRIPDDERFTTGNYYATQEYAEYKSRVSKLQNNLEKFSAEDTEPQYYKLHYICFNELYGKVCHSEARNIRPIGLPLFKNVERASQAIDKFRDELTWYLTTEPPYLFEKDNSEKIADIEVKLSFVKNEEKNLNDKLSVMKVEEKKLNDRLKELENA